MDVLYVGEPVVTDECLWPYRSMEGKYNQFYEDLDNNAGKWVTWTLADGTPRERVRSAILTHYRNQGIKVMTSGNGRRVAAKRTR